MKEKLAVKICGMRERDNIREVSSLSPDYMGFIFYNQSPRYVGDNFSIPDNLSQTIKRVGVFVNETFQQIIDIFTKHQLDYVQLHGNESPELCEELKQHNIKIIKAFSVNDDFDFSITHRYESLADFFLFDTKGKQYGGNGVTFNWQLLKRYNQHVPFFLSGGLNVENINTIHFTKNMNIHALDLNSGVEIHPGMKDRKKIGDVISAIKNLTRLT